LQLLVEVLRWGLPEDGHMPPLLEDKPVGRDVIGRTRVDSFLGLLIGMASNVLIGKIGRVDIVSRFVFGRTARFWGWRRSSALAAWFAFWCWHTTVWHSTVGDPML
jgi:hypothetical protein